MERFLKQDGPHPLSSVPLWRRINRLRNKKPTKNIPNLEENGIKYTTDHDKAQILANRLEDVFNEDKNNDYNKEHFDQINKMVEDDVISKPYSKRKKFVKAFTMRDLTRNLNNINKKTSTDQHRISNKIIKHISEITKECVLVLFNKCIDQKKITSFWKNSIVTMIQKKEPKPGE